MHEQPERQASKNTIPRLAVTQSSTTSQAVGTASTVKRLMRFEALSDS